MLRFCGSARPHDDMTLMCLTRARRRRIRGRGSRQTQRALLEPVGEDVADAVGVDRELGLHLCDRNLVAGLLLQRHHELVVGLLGDGARSGAAALERNVVGHGGARSLQVPCAADALKQEWLDLR